MLLSTNEGEDVGRELRIKGNRKGDKWEEGEKRKMKIVPLF